ncbi:MAG: glycine-rich domain-containing protein [Gammaproteobacteria bacterium]
MTTTQPNLAELLNYENNLVIQQYCKDNPTDSPDEAKQIFKDLLAWLWLNAYRKQKNLQTHMFGPLLKLDRMWHIFILHTRSYTDFCEHFFSGYFHHEVEERTLSSAELEDFLSDCYDHLGIEWIMRYFSECLESI